MGTGHVWDQVGCRRSCLGVMETGACGGSGCHLIWFWIVICLFTYTYRCWFWLCEKLTSGGLKEDMMGYEDEVLDRMALMLCGSL